MKFIKVNFDSNVHGIKGDAEYVIQNSDGMLLEAKGSYIFENLISEAELRIV